MYKFYPNSCPNLSNPSLGHWTLRGGKDPDNVIIDLNSCLFSVIGSQIGQDPLRLRKWTVLKLKDNFQNLAEWIDKILELKGNVGVILMIGGVKYKGTSSEDARKVLDNSEGKRGHKTVGVGHSRARHVFDPDPNKGVVAYTRNNPYEAKTAFLSQEDQDYVAHLALKTEQVQNIMKELNKGRLEADNIIRAEDLQEKNRELPKAKVWCGGKEKSTSPENRNGEINIKTSR